MRYDDTGSQTLSSFLVVRPDALRMPQSSPPNGRNGDTHTLPQCITSIQMLPPVMLLEYVV